MDGPIARPLCNSTDIMSVAAVKMSKVSAATLGDGALPVLCKAGSEPLRLQILRVLQHNAFGVLELCRIFEIRQPGMSHHLKILSSAGLIEGRREGTSIFYRRAHAARESTLEGVQTALLCALDATSLPAAVLDRLQDIQEARAAASRRFFAVNSQRLRERQDLIAEYPQYAEAVTKMLDTCVSEHCRRRALEIGPGDGAFLPVLAMRFRSVIALDNSQEMLKKARGTAREAGCRNIRFLLGDTGHPALQSLDADCVIASMMLHHTSSPAQVLADAGEALARGGVLLVTDLCRHDQLWVQSACGDLWLGFTPAELDSWAQQAELHPGRSIYLSLRNGFCVQVREFAKAG